MTLTLLNGCVTDSVNSSNDDGVGLRNSVVNVNDRLRLINSNSNNIIQ